MEKIIKLDENHEIKLDNNVWWCIQYKSQFGHDIVPDIMPLLSGIMNAIVAVASATGDGDSVQDILKRLDTSDLTEALIELAGLQLTDFINIIWAMAKTADESIPEPNRWVRQFDRFPLDVLVPQAGELIVRGMVSEKNWNSLQNLLTSLKANGSDLKLS